MERPTTIIAKMVLMMEFMASSFASAITEMLAD